MIVVGIDPGLAHLGAVTVEWDGQVAKCLAAGVFLSKKSDKKHGVAVADDRVDRCRRLARWLAEWLDREPVGLVACESMSWPRSLVAATAIALSWGVIVAELERRKLPLVTATPQCWRRYLCTSGAEGEAHLNAHFHVTGAKKPIDWAPKHHRAHMLDALGVSAWALSTDLARGLVRRRAEN